MERPLVRLVPLITGLGRFLLLTSLQSPPRLACFSLPWACSLAWGGGCVSGASVFWGASNDKLLSVLSSAAHRLQTNSFLPFCLYVYCRASTMFSVCILCLWLCVCVCAKCMSIVYLCVWKPGASVGSLLQSLSPYFLRQDLCLSLERTGLARLSGQDGLGTHLSPPL